MPEGSGSGVGTIVDNDNPPSAQIGDVTVAEGNSWNRDGTPERAAVEPERQADRRPDTRAADGTATAPSDYDAALNLPIPAIPAGQHGTISVPAP